ncbi:MAG: hypothetical protein WD711_05520 [Dongiaceae bacterium]
MRLTHAALAFGLFTAPFAAQAESIPPQILSDYRGSCVSSCQETQSAEHCSAMCGCVADRMKSEWTKDQYDDLARRYDANPEDPTVKSTMDGMVAQCRQTVQTGG